MGHEYIETLLDIRMSNSKRTNSTQYIHIHEKLFVIEYSSFDYSLWPTCGLYKHWPSKLITRKFISNLEKKTIKFYDAFNSISVDSWSYVYSVVKLIRYAERTFFVQKKINNQTFTLYAEIVIFPMRYNSMNEFPHEWFHQIECDEFHEWIWMHACWRKDIRFDIKSFSMIRSEFADWSS